MFDASCSFVIEEQMLLFMIKCVDREREASEKIRIPPPLFATVSELDVSRPRHVFECIGLAVPMSRLGLGP